MRVRSIARCVLLVVFLFLAGCGYVPILNQTGILPGPSPATLARVLPASQLSVLFAQYGDVGTQTCPEGEIWIGSIDLGGRTLNLNSCVPLELATQYAQGAGLL